MKQRVLSHWLLAVLAAALALFWLTVPALAAETGESEPTDESQSEPVEISTVEELLAMAEDPSGSYILTADLDMTGVEWKSLDFSGSFDGNGHAILNLTLSQPGDARPMSYDGNNKGYETSYVGLFGSLDHAQVKNLRLLNVRAVVETDEPCFLAGIAGYADHSTVTDCTVTGCLELRAHDRMFGVAGVIGHGNGSVERCTVDVTLICTDTDSQTKDEQFLGGVFATGFIHVMDCDITLDGYISDHGYVHSGGIAGMTMRYPLPDWKTVGYITGNTVTGKITFFEHNSDRRAYCAAEVGEPLASNSVISDNTTNFLRDERFEYDVELRPETCPEPVYSQTTVEPTCQSFGYTVCTCTGCGYSYMDHYTLCADHQVSQWTLAEEPTTEKEGLSRGSCRWCGLELERTEPKLEPEKTSAETKPIQTAQDAAGEPDGSKVPLLAAAAALLLIGGGALMSRKKKS